MPRSHQTGREEHADAEEREGRHEGHGSKRDRIHRQTQAAFTSKPPAGGGVASQVLAPTGAAAWQYPSQKEDRAGVWGGQRAPTHL